MKEKKMNEIIKVIERLEDASLLVLVKLRVLVKQLKMKQKNKKLDFSAYCCVHQGLVY